MPHVNDRILNSPCFSDVLFKKLLGPRINVLIGSSSVFKLIAC